MGEYVKCGKTDRQNPIMPEVSRDMNKNDALAFVAEIEKLLTDKGIWHIISNVREPDLKFIKIEVSIKIRT